jgi:hypothetical protein
MYAKPAVSEAKPSIPFATRISLLSIPLMTQDAVKRSDAMKDAIKYALLCLF